jgi:NSS family neurotransmitter:Na+ symporter
MAAIGSAVGLGNVWRYPYVCYENGGGAFIIPYFIALFTAGIPLLILEFSFGHWARTSPPEAFKKINKKWEWAGWWMALVPFVIATYYIVVMAWCFSYLIFSLNLRWGSHADQFFNSVLGNTGTPVLLGSISLPVFLSLIIMWLWVFLILYKGVDRIGKVVAITVPLPWILLGILAIRGLTLPGAVEGVNYYLTPDFSRLFDVNVWLAAYAQVFFSVGVAQGIMITYASYLKKKSDLTNNAIIVALADTGTSFFAGFAVFSIIGYLALTQGVSIPELGTMIGGPTLTFITYPTAISLFPIAAVAFGVLFYIALLTFGIDSAFSMVEPLIAGVHNKWKMTKAKATSILCLIGFLASLFFITGAGIHWLDIVDHFSANFSLVLVGLMECLLLGWVFKVSRIRDHANKTSDVKIGRWWDLLIKYLIPSLLTLLLVAAIYKNIVSPYQGYPWWVLIIGGVTPPLVIFLVSFVLMKSKKHLEAP